MPTKAELEKQLEEKQKIIEDQVEALHNVSTNFQKYKREKEGFRRPTVDTPLLSEVFLQDCDWDNDRMLNVSWVAPDSLFLTIVIKTEDNNKEMTFERVATVSVDAVSLVRAVHLIIDDEIKSLGRRAIGTGDENLKSLLEQIQAFAGVPLDNE
jgi:hypothetical protein